MEKIDTIRKNLIKLFNIAKYITYTQLAYFFAVTRSVTLIEFQAAAIQYRNLDRSLF